jgi:hypothetical protein
MGRIARFAVLLVSVLCCGCWSTRSWRTCDPPWTTASVEGVEKARLTRLDGTRVTLHYPEIVEENGATYFVGTEREGSPATKVDAREVEKLQVRHVDAERVAGYVGIGGVVVAAILVVWVAWAVATVLGG